MMVIFNLRFIASITFHNALHGFQEGRRTGTTYLETKLLQQLAAMRDKVLYIIFLDLHKAYESLDRERLLEILDGYGVVPRARCILQEYWDRLWMVARAGG